jgi:hypothetical protein
MNLRRFPPCNDPQERLAFIQEYLRTIGARGGSAGTGSAKARTSDQARAAAQARWKKRAALPKRKPT